MLVFECLVFIVVCFRYFMPATRATQLQAPERRDTDMLSYQGASAAIEAANSTNKLLWTNIRVVGVLPVMVDRRLAISTTVLEGIESLCTSMHVPMLSSIRTDSNVTKAARMGQFLVDFDPKTKAMDDYRVVATELTKLLGE